jgi:hypothetical protein
VTLPPDYTVSKAAFGGATVVLVLGRENSVLEFRTDGALGRPRTAAETVRWCKKFPAAVHGVGCLRRSGDRLVSDVEVTWCG